MIVIDPVLSTQSLHTFTREYVEYFNTKYSHFNGVEHIVGEVHIHEVHNTQQRRLGFP